MVFVINWKKIKAGKKYNKNYHSSSPTQSCSKCDFSFLHFVYLQLNFDHFGNLSHSHDDYDISWKLNSKSVFIANALCNKLNLTCTVFFFCVDSSLFSTYLHEMLEYHICVVVVCFICFPQRRDLFQHILSGFSSIVIIFSKSSMNICFVLFFAVLFVDLCIFNSNCFEFYAFHVCQILKIVTD